MSSVPDSLRILASLRTLDERGFARLIHDRKVNARGIDDLLDLAEWLEAPSNIAAALGRLDWPTLRGLRLGNVDALSRAADLQLAIGEGAERSLLPVAAEQLAQLLPEVPSYSQLAASQDADESVTPAAGTASAQHIAQLANDALWLLSTSPRLVRRTREHARLSGVEIRRLSAELETDSAVVSALYRWLHAAELITPRGDLWLLTHAGAEFCSLPVSTRWRTLVQAWLRELTIERLATLRESFGRDAAEAPSSFDEDDTAEVTLPNAIAAQLAAAAALGIADRGWLTPLGGFVLDDDLAAATELLEHHLPEEISQVYVQPDQTILAPGPLSGILDQQLRRVADLERRALASEYRLTSASLMRALNEGMGEAEIRSFLDTISLTGIPQPVDYLISSTAAAHGRVRVQAADFGTGLATRIVVADSQLRDTLAVDTALGTLALRPSGADLLSRVSPHVAHAALLDARYAAILEDENGQPLPPHDQQLAEPQHPEPGPIAARAAANLAEQAAASDHADDRLTWLQRRLEIARRNRAEVHVSIEVPGKDPVSLGLVPLSVGGQRLRALDLDADVERTLPMRSILAIDD
ncbi:helicase-associated domain-containing protein [Gulosibacter chungangensis]|uniref:helicase-associated domain-containing protein n=1 Tax=Gulosibacter chungangensis TaxID=979746 RepID=UPI001787972B|nr:helicase-associated domain-containing protein [Gulosibacter chungangensis]